jgi:hypothetical protein
MKMKISCLLLSMAQIGTAWAGLGDSNMPKQSAQVKSKFRAVLSRDAGRTIDQATAIAGKSTGIGETQQTEKGAKIWGRRFVGSTDAELSTVQIEGNKVRTLNEVYDPKTDTQHVRVGQDHTFLGGKIRLERRAALDEKLGTGFNPKSETTVLNKTSRIVFSRDNGQEIKLPVPSIGWNPAKGQ